MAEETLRLPPPLPAEAIRANGSLTTLAGWLGNLIISSDSTQAEPKRKATYSEACNGWRCVSFHIQTFSDQLSSCLRNRRGDER